MRFSLTLAEDCKAGHGKCSFFVLKSLHREHTPFQAAQIQKEHCPLRNHATHLCRDHALFEVMGGFNGGAERAAAPPPPPFSCNFKMFLKR